MRAPVSWLREYAAIPVDLAPRDLAAALVAVGMEVESVDVAGEGLHGPLLVGRVEEVTELTEFRKPIRYCQVDVGPTHGGVRGIICGAQNFTVGDLVPVALPGTVLPGGFAIAARTTYGHISDGMICSAKELSVGDEAGGIMVLGEDAGTPGDDAAALLGIGEAVLDIAVTPDRGYCLSIRGLAREAATALGVEYRDPALAVDLAGYPPEGSGGLAVQVDEPQACPQFTAVTLSGVDPQASTPLWMQARLAAAGMRSISVAVDVTNYVMLELGQPLHAFDAERVSGGIIVRRPRTGETLLTLDHVERKLDSADLLIADHAGPIGLAGTMGGLETEVSDATHTIILEAAHFSPEEVARMARRHKLPSEASKRFERSVDPQLPWIASKRAADLLTSIAGGSIDAGTGVGAAPEPTSVLIDPMLPAQVSGAPITSEEARLHLVAVGCEVHELAPDQWAVRAPSWRPDLHDPADLVEEVVRLFGYQKLPATLPAPPAGRGLTPEQRKRRAVSKSLAGAGWTEVLAYPFVGPAELAALGIDDDRVRMATLANPLSDEQAGLRTTLLPGLLAAAKRNFSRGVDGVALYELGLVFTTGEVDPDSSNTVAVSAEPIRPGVAGPPTRQEVEALMALLPDQPLQVAVVAAGVLEPQGWWGPPRRAGWEDAVEAARVVARSVGTALEVVAAPFDRAPWHPGRCAQLLAGGEVVGYAGELHPRVVEALGLPPRAAVMEANLDAILAAAPKVRLAPTVSTFPVAKEDVALIVEESVTAASLRSALARGGGDLLESVRMFDEYRGSQIPAGSKSLAFALRFRAHDRTLADSEVAAARDAAVSAAVAECGAVLRDG